MELGGGGLSKGSSAPGAHSLPGRLQQTVTFEADPGEFPPSAGPLFLPVGASSSVLAEQPVSPQVVTVLLLGLVKEEESLSLPSLAIARGAEHPCGLRLLSRSKAQPSAIAGTPGSVVVDLVWISSGRSWCFCHVSGMDERNSESPLPSHTVRVPGRHCLPGPKLGPADIGPFLP